MLAVFVVLVGRPDVASVAHRRGGHTPQSECPENENPKAVRPFAQLRRLGLSFVAVGNGNATGSRVPYTSLRHDREY
jgi:hypothetical protein